MTDRNRPPSTAGTKRSLGSKQLSALLPQSSERELSYRMLADAIGRLILDGQIALRVRLPSERGLAVVLGISRTTVTAAYNRLREAGFAHSQRGSGTWTALPSGRTLANIARTVAIDGATIDLARAAPGLSDDVIAQALIAVTPDLAAHARTPGYHPHGLLELREAIAAHYTVRGLATTPEQILVTSGAQHALTLVLSLLCGPGDRVLIETPSYPNALEALRRHRLRPVSVPVGDHGWDTGVLDATLRQSVPHLAYLIPDFHNPTGLLMPDATRAHLLHVAQHTGTWLVIDETLAEVALDVPPPVPFASHAPPRDASRVITLGSMSKTYWGGLRIGWLRAPSDLVDELASERIANDLGGSVLDQLMALHLLKQARTLLPPRLEQLRLQRDALNAALATHLPEWSWHLPPGGLSLWVDLGHPIASTIAGQARDRGIRIESGSCFSIDPGVCETRLRIPYTLSPAVLNDAAERLGAAVAEGGTNPPPRRRPQWIA